MTKVNAREMLRGISDHIEDNGYAPSLRDIQATLGLTSHSVVAYHLMKLRHLGYVSYKDGTARTLTITPEGAAYLDG